MMGVVRRICRRDDGIAMLTVVILIAFLSMVSIALINVVTSESTRSGSAVSSNASFQAAEAGLDDYLAKLVDDKTYYMHHVHPAESTRHPTSGADVDPLASGTTCNASKTGALGLDWTTGTSTWTYPNGKDNWCQLANGYEYNLQVTPPCAPPTCAGTNLNIQIVSTGRKICSPAYSSSSSCAPGTSTADWRAVQEWVHWSLLTDFQMITAGDYSVGDSATTNGKVYAGGNIVNDGTATANLYAEGNISGSTTMLNGAQKYDHNTIHDPAFGNIKAPISFSNFTSSLDDIKTAAISGGRYFDTSFPVWKFVFLSNGNFTAQGCTLTGGADPAGTLPTCSGSVATYLVPTNGAIYVETKAMVSGSVNGRVTIATNDDAIVSGNISYVTAGDDVLGLIAKNDVLIAKWTATTTPLVWYAAVIAQNGLRSSFDHACSGYDPTAVPPDTVPSGCVATSWATHHGSSASAQKPFMDMFANREYDYDSTLLYLPPPWFPVLDDAYTVALFREVNP
jgi:Tfp pilus assembly protein PilX